jgi:hypothetical protein
MIVLGFAATVLMLNATLYSPAGFVRGYLDALQRHDADGALELAGPLPSSSASHELLTSNALGDIANVALVSDTVEAGSHHIRFAIVSDGTQSVADFTVSRSGAFLGFFDQWQFDSSPLAVLDLTVLHDERAIVNGQAIVSPSPDRPAAYLVFAPNSYVLSHDTTWLHADAETIPVATGGTTVPARLEVEANAAFGKEVKRQLDAYLDSCVKQQVLLPTGCPFGQTIGNRIVSTPAWSMVAYPAVTVVPAGRVREWLMPSSAGAAHLTVDVKSLFDGSVSPFDANVSFTSSVRLTLLPDDSIQFAPLVD